MYLSHAPTFTQLLPLYIVLWTGIGCFVLLTLRTLFSILAALFNRLTH